MERAGTYSRGLAGEDGTSMASPRCGDSAWSMRWMVQCIQTREMAVTAKRIANVELAMPVNCLV